MSFPFNVYLCAFVSSWLVAFAGMPLWKGLCTRLGLVDDPGARKIHDRSIVLAGGLAVFAALVLPLMAGVVATQVFGSSFSGSDPFRYGLGRRTWQVAGILIGAGCMMLLGLLDDKYELKPLTKFTGQFLIALLVALSGVRTTLFVPNVLFSYGVTILWILTITNAMNFMDNMNGLASGISFIACWTFAWGAALHGQYLVASMGFLFCGALAGFLPRNFPAASVFLGDSGSHLAGFLLSVLAILPHFYSKGYRNTWLVLIPLLVLAVPLADLTWVVLYRTWKGKPFYIGDTNHFSHWLVRNGFTRLQAVLVLWLCAAVTGALAVLFL